MYRLQFKFQKSLLKLSEKGVSVQIRDQNLINAFDQLLWGSNDDHSIFPLLTGDENIQKIISHASFALETCDKSELWRKMSESEE